MSTRHLVVDCDPGCDDALALLLAFSEDSYEKPADRYGRIDVLTVAGNVGVNQTTGNAMRVCALAQRFQRLKKAEVAVRVWRGSARSLDGRRPTAASVHGRDGLGDVPLAALLPAGLSRKAFVRTAVTFAAETRRRDAISFYQLLGRTGKPPLGPSDLSNRDLVCTGPLTNLALALLSLSIDEQRAFWGLWDRIVFMGGAVRVPGNISFAAEFNVHADPHSWEIVLASHSRARDLLGTSVPPLIVVPLDVTEHVFLVDTRGKLPRGSALGRAVLCLLRKYFLFHAHTYLTPARWDGDQEVWKRVDGQEESWRKRRSRRGSWTVVPSEKTC